MYRAASWLIFHRQSKGSLQSLAACCQNIRPLRALLYLWFVKKVLYGHAARKPGRPSKSFRFAVNRA